MKATPAVTSRPANIQVKAWLRKAAASLASGTTPRPCGVLRAPVPAGTPGASGVPVVLYRTGLSFCVIESILLRLSGSPHQAGVARIPALGQQGHFHVMVHDRFGLLLDLGDHRSGIRAERRGEDHLHFGAVGSEDDLLDQRELDDVHADLGV